MIEALRVITSELDHAKAELVLEAALERVRTKAMGMDSSEHIGETSLLLFDEIRALCPDVLRAGIGVIKSIDEFYPWLVGLDENGTQVLIQGNIIRRGDRSEMDASVDAWVEGTGYSFKESPEFLQWVVEALYSGDASRIVNVDAPHDQYLSTVVHKTGFLFVVADHPVSPESEEGRIVSRFGSAFDIAYQKYLDLREADVRVREAQIETALERVRSQAMAMRTSDELMETARVVFEQLSLLGFNLFLSAWEIYNDETSTADAWLTFDSEAHKFFTATATYEQFESDPLNNAHLKSWRKKEPFFQGTLEGNVLKANLSFLASMKEQQMLSGTLPEFDLDDKLYASSARFSRGYLTVGTKYELDESDLEILGRVTKAFELAYQRFEDLQKAEAQAREAQIEAAMERIRARAMAMHSSDELIEVAAELRRQMDALGQEDLQACVIHLYEDGADRFQSLSALRPPGDTGEIITGHVTFPIDSHESLVEMMAMYASPETDYTIVIDKEKGDKWQAVMVRESPEFAKRVKKFLGDIPTENYHQYWSFSDFSGGSVLMVTHAPASEEARALMKRSAKVVDLAYRRYLDLRQAEAQAREAKIEASLERVRGRAMAMQEPDDLSDVSILMFDELADLGISSLRSGISIPLDEERYEFRAATKKTDGTTTLVVGNESINVHPIIRRAYDGYEQQEEFQKTILKGEDLVEYYHSVFDTMPLPDWKERMKTGAEAQEGFATFPFSDGWLYTFTHSEMDDEEIDVFVRFAKVFGLAYQRYHDLLKAAEDYKALLDEKAKTEMALSELQATQNQLIEQEKLASLGALTAGIAHEIKNPLNFVNNFAEVSAELADELSEAVAAGNTEEVEIILTDLRQNSEQIAKHGKRADSIVRSMMQHARGGTSEKEIIDINNFVDEYVNLAWHGMRAREHGFQADVVKDFDDEIGSISILPQEIGRVLLNLLNNAFQALTSVASATESPLVTIATKRSGGSVEISVADNGPGIPAELRDKIFEPFFTTKATGEGTGLGLSLSYDIVSKGHGGTLNVKTTVGGGATFIVRLPAEPVAL